jgi:maltose alpha-D-glucosyltransferase / alpha-amylase
MVTVEDREWMWRHYAPEAGQKLNMGIRRRLAPLMENDPRRILLMHSLLLTMMGSPFLYYGDEIGMGDNNQLRDRNGLRTPMQWDASVNAGFSTAPADKLYAPVITDPVFGYMKVNVAAQEADASSILNQLRHLIAVRKQSDVFGLGEFAWKHFEYDKKVAAYTLCYAGEELWIVNNLSSEAVNGWLSEDSALFTDMLTGKVYGSGDLRLEPYQFLWLKPETTIPSQDLVGPSIKLPGDLGSDKH